jgi:hypothetical protein
MHLICCVRRAGVICSYLLRRRALVKADEPVEEIVVGGVVLGFSGEVVLKGRVGELLGE